jgi:hypothetical protein
VNVTMAEAKQMVCHKILGLKTRSTKHCVCCLADKCMAFMESGTVERGDPPESIPAYRCGLIQKT